MNLTDPVVAMTDDLGLLEIEHGATTRPEHCRVFVFEPDTFIARVRGWDDRVVRALVFRIGGLGGSTATVAQMSAVSVGVATW